MTRQPRTLLGHLLAWCLGALGLLWLSFIAAGYQTGRHETDELVDGHLASVTTLVAQLAGSGRWLSAPAQADAGVFTCIIINMPVFW